MLTLVANPYIPDLPNDIREIILKYAPILVLAASVLNGGNIAALIIGISNNDQSAFGLLPAIGVYLGLVSVAAGFLAFIWLSQKRRLGWNTLAFALIFQLLSQVMMTGVSTILFIGLEIAIITYLMLQVRDSYTR